MTEFAGVGYGAMLRGALGSLRTQRAEDTERYDVLDKIATDLRPAFAEGNLLEVQRLVKRACDLEYDLTLDCKAFGPLSDKLETFFGMEQDEWPGAKR